MSWLRGLEPTSSSGRRSPSRSRLIDFDDPRQNTLVISTEVLVPGRDRAPPLRHRPLGQRLSRRRRARPRRRSRSGKSWLNAAQDIHDVYEIRTPGFFVPNVLSFATEGKDFRYGAVGLPPELWLPWGKTDDAMLPLGLARVLRCSELLLTPELVLDILRSFTLYATVQIGAATAVKILPRYPQVEAVEALVAARETPDQRQGLIWHHQGSGKTLAHGLRRAASCAAS